MPGWRRIPLLQGERRGPQDLHRWQRCVGPIRGSWRCSVRNA